MEAYDGPQIVGMDLHRRRSVLVRMSEDGRKLATARITNSPARLATEIKRAGVHPKVVLEACYGWYWAADALAAAGAEVHLAHPLGVKAFSCRRVKNDELDARDLADLLRMGRLPEAWIAPAEIRELREITRYRHKLVKLRTGCKDQVHGILAKLGIEVTCSDIFGAWGTAWLDELPLPQPYSWKVASLRQLIGWLTSEITVLEQVSAELLAGRDTYRAVRELLEACYGWYWAADALAAAGAEVHLAHPLGVKAFSCRRVKNDELDARDLADLLRMGRLPEAWIAPAEIRELREITRYRHKLVKLRTGCKDQVHGILAKLGIEVTCSDIFGAWGTAWLDELPLPQPYSWKVASLRQLIGWLTSEITVLEQVSAELLAGRDTYRAVRELPGIGPVLAAVIVAEIGDITRFRHPARLCSWAGLTPRHYESDTTVIRGRITKQGSPVLRWALIEAVQHTPDGTPVRQARDTIIARRGPQARNIAKVAAARKLLTYVFYAMRDGHVRALDTPAAEHEAG